MKEAILITRDWFTHFWWLIKEENFGKAYSHELKIMTGNFGHGKTLSFFNRISNVAQC